MVKNAKPPIAMGKYDALAYGEQRAGEWMDKHGIPITSRKMVDDVADRARPGGLLGGKNGTIVTVTTSEQAADIVARLTKTSSGDRKAKATADEIRANAARLAGDGMFIILRANAATKGPRDLMKIFKDNGFTFEEPGKNADSMVSKLMKTVSLSPQVRAELLAYVGEEYDSLLPIVRSIAKMPVEEQKALTWTDVSMRLAVGKGSVAPWGSKGQPGLSEYMTAGDVAGAIEYYQRLIAGGSLPIMFVGWLGKTIADRALTIALMRMSGEDAEAAAAIIVTKGNSRFVARDSAAINRRCRALTVSDFLALSRLTAMDMTMIRKRGRQNRLDDDGKPIKKENGSGYVFDWVDCPVREVLDDDVVGLRMVVRAAKTFSGDPSCVRRRGRRTGAIA